MISKSKKNNSKKTLILKKTKTSSFEIFNPATLTKIGELPLYTTDMVEEKILLAKQAQVIWNAKSLKERSKELILFRKFLANNKEEMISCICNETGKTKMDALLEVFATLESIDYISKKGIKILSRERRSSGLLLHKYCYVDYHPFGVVGVISPWNYPLILSVIPIMNALIAGNSVVIKPSEITPYTTLKVLEFFQRAGITNGILQVVTGKGDAGAALVSSSNTNMICFTGSTATGKLIAESCGKMLKPVVLELGGKDPMIVFKDVDLRRAVRGALWGGLSNSGQTCISVERVYVEKAIYNEFISLLKEEFPSIGSMTFPKQVDILESHYKDAKANGAFFVAGGKRVLSEKGLFHEPTIIIGVNHDMKIMKEETFGPEISIMEFNTEEEAVTMANDSDYGLSASVWTNDIRKAKSIAKKLQVGSVSINDVVTNYMISDLPFGGFKKSGIGRVHGPEGLRTFAQVQAVSNNRWFWRFSDELWWFPYSKKIYFHISNAVKTFFG
ncbi:MAG: aldehyde dehydrogenase family protein [Leptospiraceae bacterium]|nr:aldehyde dehydrogenase family protein [Leptospiraceae bacterium]